MRLYDTATRSLREFAPREAGKVSMYVCGATVQARPHVGHVRSGVAFDVLVRWLRASGYEVTLVRNVTDIDDKIIRRAVENNETIGSLTDRFIRYMDEDAARLGVYAHGLAGDFAAADKTERGLIAGVNFQLRFAPIMLAIRDAIDRGLTIMSIDDLTNVKVVN